MAISTSSLKTNFFFKSKIFFKENQDKVLTYVLEEHAKEFNQRLKILLLLSVVLMIGFLINIKVIAQLLEFPVQNVKFFQLSPNEYFFSSIKLGIYTGILVSCPFYVNQLIVFLSPSFSFKEQTLVFPLILLSIVLFFLSLSFTFFILLPAALNFFLNYNEGVLEPLWSFTEYFDFSTTLFIGTALVFQLPIMQVLLSLLKIINLTNMKKSWKYIILLSTILGAIITPSTDPITQLLLSSVILLLYGLGLLLVEFYNDEKI